MLNLLTSLNKLSPANHRVRTSSTGVPTYVLFTVTSGNSAIDGAAVTLTGAASGNGVTNQNGQAILLVNSTGTGTITASTTKTGYSSASTTFSAAGQPALSVSASPSNVTNGVSTYVVRTSSYQFVVYN